MTKQMLNSGNCFSPSLSLTSLTLSASSQAKETSCKGAKEVKKKHKSPNQRNLDFLRKENYLKKKLESTSPTFICEEPVIFNCDHC